MIRTLLSFVLLAVDVAYSQSPSAKNVDITADRPFGIYNAVGVRMENCKITTPEGLNQIVTTSANIEMIPPVKAAEN